MAPPSTPRTPTGSGPRGFRVLEGGAIASPSAAHPPELPDAKIRLLEDNDADVDAEGTDTAPSAPGSADVSPAAARILDRLAEPRTFKRSAEPPPPETLYQFWNGLIARNFPNRIPTLAEQKEFYVKHVINSPLRWLWIVLAISTVAVFILILFGGEVFPFFVRAANTIRDLGALGMVCMALVIMISALPPMIGYGTLNYVSGFIFGIWGIIPSYCGALSGAILCWILTRIVLGNDYGESIKRAYPQWGLMERAIHKRGLRLLILIRLAPYPYSIMNVILATMKSIPMLSYVFSTAIALPKLIVHVYLGSTVKDLADIGATTPGKVVVLVLFGGIGLAMFLYLGYVVGREMNEFGVEESLEEAVDVDGDAEGAGASFADRAEPVWPAVEGPGRSHEDGRETIFIMLDEDVEDVASW
ncbi:hypothetical protein DFJ74DRAFT_388653 [Hyaloraphidium curvatum]|nr:hypothetical protein DFJ74DRAFT_388653 [Hyaloraphidium curvatum]